MNHLLKIYLLINITGVKNENKKINNPNLVESHLTRIVYFFLIKVALNSTSL